MSTDTSGASCVDAAFAPVGRRPLHRRTIELQGYERDDGLFEVEATLFDMKNYAFETSWRGVMHPGDPLHNMKLRVAYDVDFVIQEVEAQIIDAPFPVCPAAASAHQAMVGVRMSSGFTRAVRENLGGVQACAHLRELMGPIATIAYQTAMPVLERRRRERGDPAPEGKPMHLDQCYALASDGEVVAEHWPEHYTGG